jgi:hypothetical protein
MNTEFGVCGISSVQIYTNTRRRSDERDPRLELRAKSLHVTGSGMLAWMPVWAH